MNSQVLGSAKAWVALIGAVVTALLGTVGPSDPLFNVLTAVAAVCTAIATYVVPNSGDSSDAPAPLDHP
jgi:hypothetical protein